MAYKFIGGPRRRFNNRAGRTGLADLSAASRARLGGAWYFGERRPHRIDSMSTVRGDFSGFTL